MARRRLALVRSGRRQVGLYKRVSSDEQEERHTIEGQTLYLRERLANEDLDVVDEYDDDGWSGAIEFGNRPAGARLLADAAAHRFDLVIVYKFDRLARDQWVQLDIQRQLARLGVGLRSLSENLSVEPDDEPFVMYMFQQTGANAQLERANIRERTMNGKHREAYAGRVVNGRIPFGYDVSDDHRMVPSVRLVAGLSMTESDLVADIYRRVVDGESTYQIADWLRAAGVESRAQTWNKRDRRMVSSVSETGWHARRVWETIHNQTYGGSRNLSFDRRGEVKQDVPPLVSQDVWQAANDRLTTNNSWDGKREGYVYLLRRKLRCTLDLPNGSTCDQFYVGGRAGTHRYYTCGGVKSSTVQRRDGVRCGARLISADLVEATLWAELRALVTNPATALAKAQAAIVAQRESTGDATTGRRAELRRKLDRADYAQRMLREELSQGERDFAEVREDLKVNGEVRARLEAELTALDDELAAASALERQHAAAVATIGALRDELDDIEATSDRREMQRYLDRLVREVVVEDGRTKTPRLKIHWRFVRESSAVERKFTNIQTTAIWEPVSEAVVRRSA